MYIQECNDLCACFAPRGEETKVRKGIKINRATTLSMPDIPGWHPRYYNSITGCHGGVVLAMHIDDGDFGMGHISIQTKDDVDPQEILVHFCFPTLGFAIPLRDKEHLFFNPLVPHMISSKSRSSCRILPLSMYLKKDIMGLNNNKLKLTPEQKSIRDTIGFK